MYRGVNGQLYDSDPKQHEWDCFPNWVEEGIFAPLHCKKCDKWCFYNEEWGPKSGHFEEFTEKCPAKETWRDKPSML